MGLECLVTTSLSASEKALDGHGFLVAVVKIEGVAEITEALSSSSSSLIGSMRLWPQRGLGDLERLPWILLKLIGGQLIGGGGGGQLIGLMDGTYFGMTGGGGVTLRVLGGGGGAAFLAVGGALTGGRRSDTGVSAVLGAGAVGISTGSTLGADEAGIEGWIGCAGVGGWG